MNNFKHAIVLTKTRGLLGAIAVGLLMASSAAQAAIINVGNYSFTANTGVKTISLFVNGTEQIAGEDFYAQLGDGGSFNGGTNSKPSFSSVNIIAGTIFGSNNTGASGDPSPGGNAAHPLIWVDGTTTGSGTVQLQSNSLLATLQIDTTSAPVGSYPLLLSGVAGSMGGFTTTLRNASGVAIPLTITNGTINIVSVPEPSAILALGVPTMLFLTRRQTRAARV